MKVWDRELGWKNDSSKMWMFFSAKCTSKTRLDGKTAVVTGCSAGIGKATATDLVKRGCRVVMACRDVAKAETAAQEILESTGTAQNIGMISVVRLDLSSFASVRQCAIRVLQTETQINFLVNNAGVSCYPKTLTEDGFETHFATNYLGHFLFTMLLLPRILNSTPARIIMVSSTVHSGGNIDFEDIHMEKSYNATTAYCRSKLAMILFSTELAKRLTGKGVTTYSVHPGTVNTNLGVNVPESGFFRAPRWLLKHMVSYVIKTPEQGAQTTVFCAVDEGAGAETGLFYAECKKRAADAKARDVPTSQRLWDESIKWVGLQDFNPFTTEDHPPATGQAQKFDENHILKNTEIATTFELVCQ